jgi:hypothetical protein
VKNFRKRNGTEIIFRLCQALKKRRKEKSEKTKKGQTSQTQIKKKEKKETRETKENGQKKFSTTNRLPKFLKLLDSDCASSARRTPSYSQG